MDTYVFSPKEAAAAQQAANLAELTLHVIPLGAAADNLAQGNYKEAAISFAGDVAMLLTGGGSKAIATALKAKKYVKSAETAAKGLQTAGMITEASIAGIRGVQGGWKLYESGGKSGYGEIGDAILRTFGVRLMMKHRGPASVATAAEKHFVDSFVEGRRGGQIVSDSALEQLERGLLRDRVVVSRNADAMLAGDDAAAKLRVYRDGSATMFLRSNPTRYEILHESQHIEYLRQIGPERYRDLRSTPAGNLQLEQYVYDNLRRYHWPSLTPAEIRDAQRYIRRLGGNAW